MVTHPSTGILIMGPSMTLNGLTTIPQYGYTIQPYTMAHLDVTTKHVDLAQKDGWFTNNREFGMD